MMFLKGYKWIIRVMTIFVGFLIITLTLAQHSVFVSGRHECNGATGRYEITWFVYNSETDPVRIMRITSVTRAVDGIELGKTVGPGQLIVGKETMPADFTGRVTLGIGVVWEYTDPDTADEYSATVHISGHCYDNPTYTPLPQTATPTEYIPHSVVPTETPVATTPERSEATHPDSGINLAGCGRECPIFKVYHTDETGGWEIFRLDSADKITRISIHNNLSFGLDAEVKSIAPSLSPYNEWVVFSSDRDGNWELYVAPTSGGDPDAVQRVTFNTVAIDADPVWGPNNIVVYETTRHGNWDLYALDMSTGAEYRLTNDSGNDINAYWSPDGSRVVFQSDRPDADGLRRWQIYALNLATLEVHKLSDGSTVDVDPEYNSTGNRIAFRSYEHVGSNGVVETMSAEGTDRMVISDPAGDATNAVWSPNDTHIAYQSDLDGDLDIYIFELASGLTRQLTDNTIDDYAPTWLCDNVRLVFTSDVTGDPNIFEANSLPITGEPILVDPDADQMTFNVSHDIYPMSYPPEENASREGATVLGTFGSQTLFLNPDVDLTAPDLSAQESQRTDWPELGGCPVPKVNEGG